MSCNGLLVGSESCPTYMLSHTDPGPAPEILGLAPKSYSGRLQLPVNRTEPSKSPSYHSGRRSYKWAFSQTPFQTCIIHGCQPQIVSVRIIARLGLSVMDMT